MRKHKKHWCVGREALGQSEGGDSRSADVAGGDKEIMGERIQEAQVHHGETRKRGNEREFKKLRCIRKRKG